MLGAVSMMRRAGSCYGLRNIRHGKSVKPNSDSISGRDRQSQSPIQGRMARWHVWGILFCLAWNWVILGNHFFVLRQYDLLDHVPRFSVNRKCNVPLTALALRPIRK